MHGELIRLLIACVLLAGAAGWPWLWPKYGWWLSLVCFCSGMIIRPIYRKKPKRGQESLTTIHEILGFLTLVSALIWLISAAKFDHWRDFVRAVEQPIPLLSAGALLILIAIRDFVSLRIDPVKTRKKSGTETTSRKGSSAIKTTPK